MEDADWIHRKAAGTLYPAQVEAALIQIREVWPAEARSLRETIENFPPG
jgi:hypothetical protein